MSSNYSRIKIDLESQKQTLDKIRLNIPFNNFTIPWSFICFYELHFELMSKTIHKGDNVIKNIECLFFFLVSRFELNFLDKKCWVSDNQI